MKRIIMCMLFVSCAAYQESQNTPAPIQNLVFRDAYWGMTKKQVQYVEKNVRLIKRLSSKDMLLFQTEMFGDKYCGLFYQFAGNKLVGCGYSFLNIFNYNTYRSVAESVENDDKYVAYYESFKKGITDKYGAAIEDTTIIKCSDIDENDSMAKKVKTGCLEKIAKWETEQAIISCRLFGGENIMIGCGVSYQPKYMKTNPEDNRSLF